MGISAICILCRPRWLQDGPKRRPRHPKTPLRGCKRAPRGPKSRHDEPREGPRRPQDGPKSPPSRLQVACKSHSKIILYHKGPQETARAPQEPPRGPQELPGGPQEAPKIPPKASQEAHKRHPNTTFMLHFQAFDEFAAQTADCMKRGRRSFAVRRFR